MQKRAFTLLELIVVIATTTILANMLAPVLGAARRLGRTTLCQGQQRQIAAALTLYELQHRRRPPAFTPWDAQSAAVPESYQDDDFAGDPRYDPLGRWWFQTARLEPPLLQCPDRRVQGDNQLWGNYGVNEHLFPVLGRPDWRQLTGAADNWPDLEQPCETPLLLDCGYVKMGWYHAINPAPWRLLPLPEHTAYVPGLSLNQEKPLLPAQLDDARAGRHPGRTVNLTLADGHVENTPAAALECVTNARSRGGYAWTKP